MNLDPARLWAKSQRDNEGFHSSMLLPQHLIDVRLAAVHVLDATGNDQFKALGLDPTQYRDRFRRCVILAAAIHDIGKANDHFQGMINGTRDVRINPQGLRHEWVTVLMLRHLRDWLLPSVGGSETDFAIVEWAVAGHHPALDHASPPLESPTGGGSGTEMTLQLGFPDFKTILAELQAAFSLGSPPSLKCETAQLCGPYSVFENELSSWRRTATRIWNKFKRCADSLFASAVKSCLIAADIAGSALPRAKPHDPDRWSWITESFADRPVLGDLQRVADHRLCGKQPRPFQMAVANSKNRVTYVKAGCGSGKTLAAYLWAATNHPTRRLYFCYPTTGTATEGFRDYLFEPDGELGGIGADLFHGRAEVDFELVLGTGRDADPDDSLRRLDALRAWKTPVVSCTVDTVLGLMQNNRRGLFGWPALAQSAFVFDEIHAFDDKLFGALLEFLRHLRGVPALLMTASLPKAREIALREALGTLDPIPGPTELEERPRYRRPGVEGDDPLTLVNATLEAGGKVLWVCNTVGRVMNAAGRIAGRTPFIYHSRFKYEHRVLRHKDVIDAFRGPGPAVAVCSQVAEMSLDLSADLLVTDLATVPALIQRLGRLNRRAEAGDPTKPFVVVEPGGPKPYTSADLSTARAWLAQLPVEGISQQHLADAWAQDADDACERVDCAWIDGGPVTTVKELRNGSPGITVLMQEDIPRVKKTPKDILRLALPMPITNGWERWPRERGLPVAPLGAIIYDATRGAEWKN